MKISFNPLHTRTPGGKGPLGGISFDISSLSSLKDGTETKTSSDQVFGRTDPIFHYEGTNRKVSVGFQIGDAQTSDAAARNNARDIGLLMQLLYPAYIKEEKRGPVLGAPPLFNVILAEGDDLKAFDEIGYISGFGYSADESQNSTSLITGGTVIAVKIYQISFDFSIIHREVAGFDIAKVGIGDDTRLKTENPFYPFDQLKK